MLMVSSSNSDTNNNNNNSIIIINNNNINNNIKCYNKDKNIKCRTMYEAEIPCRDTDPDPAMAEERDDSDQLNRASPMAFTIDFGLGENTPEKAKKMERFALRSSLRKPRSPRTEPKQTDNQDKCSSPLQNGVLGLVKSSAVKSKNALTKTVTNGSDAASCTTKEVVKRKVSGSALVSPTTAAARRLTTVISPGSEFTNFAQEARKMSEPPRSERENPGRGSQSHTRATDSSAFNRRLTTTISPEDSKIFVEQVQCKIESLEIVENYDEDSFEPDDNDSEEDHRNFEKFLNDDSSLSETGTYTIDKDKEEKGVKDARNDLETLVGPNDGSYVSDWANQHRNSRGEDLNISMSSSKGSDGSRARRKLPPTPGAQPARSPDALNFSPDSGESGSGMTPPEMQDSDEGETSFMKHTQHLVDVMEARISKQETSTKSSHGKTIMAKSSSSVSKTKTTATRVTGSNGVIQHTTNTTYTRDKEQEKNPMEAWKRRKNYDPLAAAGKKKEAKGRINELTRKSSSPCLDTRNSSSSSSPRDSAPLSSLRIDDFDDEDPTTSVDHTATASKATASLTRGTQPPLIRGPVAGRSGLSQGRRPAPANSQTKSGSDSSGYFSRNDGGRFSLRTKTVTENVATRSNAPDRPSSSRSPHLKKLVQSNSSLKKSSSGNRSNSSLTSKEAEFQAWKRRKNYNPLKSAAGARKSTSPSSSGPVAPSKSAYSPSPTGHASHNGHAPLSGHAASQSHAPHSGHAPLSGHAPSKHFHHSRIRDMTQSLMFESSDESVPMQRSMSFHYPDPMGRVVTSEDESNDDYGSGCDSARSGKSTQPRSYPHYYLDEDELILPIYPQGSQARINEMTASLATKSLSPKISPSRSRSKLEALDNLVISTIYSVSSKLCGTSAHLIRQAGDAYPPTDEDQAATLETVLYLLDDVDLPSSPAKKTSRELSGTLRNLKKVEQALEVLSKIVCDDS